MSARDRQYAYSHMAEKNVANVSTDRILKLKQRFDGVGRRTLNQTRLMTGEVELHAIQDAGLWYLSYKQKGSDQGAGQLPEQLKQRWTSFNQLMKYVRTYYDQRGVDIEEVIA